MACSSVTLVCVCVCQGDVGIAGPLGPEGAQGTKGEAGSQGKPGSAGKDGISVSPLFVLSYDLFTVQQQAVIGWLNSIWLLPSLSNSSLI